MKATLALENGIWYEGEAAGAAGETGGEVVFNTSMTGYQEVLTDPSYAGQIVTMLSRDRQLRRLRPRPHRERRSRRLHRPRRVADCDNWRADARCATTSHPRHRVDFRTSIRALSVPASSGDEGIMPRRGRSEISSTAPRAGNVECSDLCSASLRTPFAGRPWPDEFTTDVQRPARRPCAVALRTSA